MRYILHFNDFSLFFFFHFCNIRLHTFPGNIAFFRVGACIRNFLLSRESILEIIKKTVFKFGLGEHFNVCNLQPSLSYMSFESCAPPYDLKKVIFFVCVLITLSSQNIFGTINSLVNTEELTFSGIIYFIVTSLLLPLTSNSLAGFFCF